jgi:two-component system KDP operon response regulator KdpE
VYVRQLRRKLGDDAAAPIYILTEPGVGYRWLREPEPALP